MTKVKKHEPQSEPTFRLVADPIRNDEGHVQPKSTIAWLSAELDKAKRERSDLALKVEMLERLLKNSEAAVATFTAIANQKSPQPQLSN